LADPWVSKNPGWSEATEIEWEDGPIALTISGVNDHLFLGDLVLLASDGDLDWWWVGLAADEVGTIELIIGGLGLLGHSVSDGLWASQEGCTSVGDHIGGFGTRVRADSNRVHLELEVGGRREWDISTLHGSTVGLIDSTIGEDTAGDIVGGALLLEEDGEEASVDDVVGAGLDEWWGDIVNSQGLEGQSHDSIDDVLFQVLIDRGGLSEDTVGDDQLGGSHGANTEGIHTQDSLSRAGTILNAPGLAIGLIGGRFGLIEEVLSLATLALRVGDPQVGRASVGDDHELLLGGSEGDIGDVFEVLVVVHGVLDYDFVRGFVFNAHRLLVLAVGGPETSLHKSRPRGHDLRQLDLHCGKAHANKGQKH